MNRSARSTLAPAYRSAALAALVGAASMMALPACTAVPAGGLGTMMGQEFQDGAQIVHYDRSAESVWARTKETLAHLSSRQPRFNDEEFVAFATVDEGAISVAVVALGNDRCRVAVKARRYGLQSADLALSVVDRIHEQVER